MNEAYYLVRVRLEEGRDAPPHTAILAALTVGVEGAVDQGEGSLTAIAECGVERVQEGPLGGLYAGGGRRIR